MAGFPNPVHSILQGILTGYSVANQIRRAALEEARFQQEKEERERQAQIQDLEARLRLAAIGRPVIGGVVAEEVPGSAVPRMRPAKNTIKYKTKAGEVLEYEPYSPDELEQRRVNLERQLVSAKAKAETEAKLAARNDALKTFGVPIGKEISSALGLPEDMRVLPDELRIFASSAEEISRLKSKAEEAKQDPVHQIASFSNDRGDATIVMVHKSGRMTTSTLKGAAKTADASMSPTEQRLHRKEARDEKVEQIVGDILQEYGFDHNRALQNLGRYFVDRPHLAPYRAEVWRRLTSRSVMNPIDVMAMQAMERLGVKTPASPGGTDISPEAAEYLKRKGLAGGR